LLFGLLSRTPAERQTAGPGVDLGDPEAVDLRQSSSV
jgi:hypothetical protein